MRLYILAILPFLALAGCGSPRYKTAMVTPAPANTAAPTTFEDDSIKATFELERGNYHTGQAWDAAQTYHGIGVVLENKTDTAIVIDWNKVAFKDTAGSSGNAVTHKGVRYLEASGPKAPTSLPPHQSMSDIITPCSAIDFGGGEAGWVVDMFHTSEPHIKYGLYLPLMIGDKQKDYSFDFIADADETPEPASNASSNARGSRSR